MQVARAEWRPLWPPTNRLEPVLATIPHWLPVQSCPTVPRNLRPAVSVHEVRRFADLGGGPRPHPRSTQSRVKHLLKPMNNAFVKVICDWSRVFREYLRGDVKIGKFGIRFKERWIIIETIGLTFGFFLWEELSFWKHFFFRFFFFWNLKLQGWEDFTV